MKKDFLTVLDLSAKDYVLVSIGRIVKRKAMDVLIKALSKISDKNVKLIIMGDGPEREELTKLAIEQKVNDSISVYEFSSIINESFTNQEKFELMKNLWRVIYEDGKLDSHEDQLIKIIGSTLNLEHKDIIGAKLFVKQEMGK